MKVTAENLDIGALNTTDACNKPTDIQLRHPITNAALPVYVTCVGKHGDTFREYQREQIDSRIRKNASASRRGKQPEPTTAEEQEAEACELLAACTTGFFTRVPGAKKGEYSDVPTIVINGISYNSGSVAEYIRLYTEQLWVRLQMDEGIGDLENFMPG